VPAALPYPKHLDLATLGSRHYLHELPERFKGPTKIIITKREKTSSTLRSDDAGPTATRYRDSTRCADRCNSRPARIETVQEGGGPIPDLHPIPSDEPQSATPRNPELHPNQRAGLGPSPIPAQKTRTSTRWIDDAASIAILTAPFSRISEHAENTEENTVL